MTLNELERETTARYAAYMAETGDGFLGNCVDSREPWYKIELPLAICAEE